MVFSLSSCLSVLEEWFMLLPVVLQARFKLDLSPGVPPPDPFLCCPTYLAVFLAFSLLILADTTYFILLEGSQRIWKQKSFIVYLSFLCHASQSDKRVI